MTGAYGFAAQLAIGEGWEDRLDAFFLGQFGEAGLEVRRVGMDEQRRGIDRVFVGKATGEVHTVEYKADSLAGRTGNAFVETVSVDTTGKPGWAVSSQADVLVYLVMEPETIYWVPMKRVRAALGRWRRMYREAAAQNEGYRTLGLLVPLAELERIAVKVW
jgi:hypothetical protein